MIFGEGTVCDYCGKEIDELVDIFSTEIEGYYNEETEKLERRFLCGACDYELNPPINERPLLVGETWGSQSELAYMFGGY